MRAGPRLQARSHPQSGPRVPTPMLRAAGSSPGCPRLSPQEGRRAAGPWGPTVSNRQRAGWVPGLELRGRVGAPQPVPGNPRGSALLQGTGLRLLLACTQQLLCPCTPQPHLPAVSVQKGPRPATYIPVDGDEERVALDLLHAVQASTWGAREQRVSEQRQDCTSSDVRAHP